MRGVGVVREMLAEKVRPGHVMVDGVVLATSIRDGVVTIEFRNVVYAEKVGATVQTIGRVPHDLLRAIQTAERARGSLGRES